jgi:hypothetical protein
MELSYALARLERTCPLIGQQFLGLMLQLVDVGTRR